MPLGRPLSSGACPVHTEDQSRPSRWIRPRATGAGPDSPRGTVAPSSRRPPLSIDAVVHRPGRPRRDPPVPLETDEGLLHLPHCPRDSRRDVSRGEVASHRESLSHHLPLSSLGDRQSHGRISILCSGTLTSPFPFGSFTVRHHPIPISIVTPHLFAGAECSVSVLVRL